MANIKARRKLSDLYKRGVELRFGKGPDGQPTHRLPKSGEGLLLDKDGKPIPVGEDEIQLWVQPASPLHREMAMRDAQAARAKALVRAKREKDSEEHLTIMAFLADMDDETLIDYVLLQAEDERRADAIREVMADEEWKDMETYRDALRTFDESGMTLEELEQDPEYVAMQELDIKFGKQVSDRMAELAEAHRDVLKMQLGSSRDIVERKALEKRAEMVGTQAFMYEYELQMSYYSVRDFEDNGVMFFESPRELAQQPDEVREALRLAIGPFITDGAEAKNSQGVASGSDSSELPSAPETSEASTPGAVTE